MMIKPESLVEGRDDVNLCNSISTITEISFPTDDHKKFLPLRKDLDCDCNISFREGSCDLVLSKA